MKTEIINCDCCGKVIAGGTWEDAPGKVVFHFGPPEQAHTIKVLEHVCYSCRKRIMAVLNETFEKLAPKPTASTPA